MRTDILEYLQNEIYLRCKKTTNKFGMGCYYHIEAVVKNGEILAEKYNADKEIVMIAAWLHDIASITDYALYEDKDKNKVVAEYALKDMTKPIGVSEYKLMNILPEELKNTLPSVEDIEARVLKKYDCD